MAMLMVLSPAKSLNFAPPEAPLAATDPEMKSDIRALAAVTRRLKASDLKQLMDLSDSLAELNRQRFKAFKSDGDDGLQAALAFNGDVYIGLAARSLCPQAMDYAQGHVRILSGLYGLLRPLDRIQPYRLEMHSRLKTRRGDNLYAFWGAKIAKALNAAAVGHEDPTLVNLASQEYFGAVDRKALKLPLITCHFKEEGDGRLRTLSFFAKRARGMMARFAIDNRIERTVDLRAFAADGYVYRPDLSTATDWVFAR